MLHLTKEQIRRLYRVWGNNIFDSDSDDFSLDEGCFIIPESDVRHLLNWSADEEKSKWYRPTVLDELEKVLEGEKDD